MYTLQEVKDYLRKHWKDGCHCLACGQHVKLYSRPITSAMAYGLLLIYKNPNVSILEWIHAEDFFKKQKDLPSSIRGDFSKLRYWGLIEAHNTMEGHYRITEKGINFILANTKVESNVLLYNNKMYGFKGNFVSFKQCLQKKFNYELLMKGVL